MKRDTAQRRVILRTLAEAPGPLTPQEVHDLARREHEGLGLATVYRNLHRMTEAGDVVEVHLPGDSTRFEPAGRGHHHHFRCQRCDGVFELTAACPVAMPAGIILPGGYRVRHHELTLYGLCPGCQG